MPTAGGAAGQQGESDASSSLSSLLHGTRAVGPSRDQPGRTGPAGA